MDAYVFTYGTDGMPYSGGWTEIEAPDMRSACALFRAIHPDRTPGILNCACVYSLARFQKTDMWESGNFGARCREKVSVAHVVNEEERQ